MNLFKAVVFAFILIFNFQTFAQDAAAEASIKSASDEPRIPNSKRIRRTLNLIVGVDHDEEFLIPERDITAAGRTDFFDISRIKGTDFFRISPKKAGNGITTLKDKKTGQILVEIRFSIRDDTKEKILREVQSLLGDIEGIEFKIINDQVWIDGYALLPKDLLRIAQVTTVFEGNVKSMATLSPLSLKKIAEFISNEVNNPEVKISAVGSNLKLEGQVNSTTEEKRILEIVKLYMPDIVVETAAGNFTPNVMIVGRNAKTQDISGIIINLLTIKTNDEKVEPPPKMVQIVAHFVKFADYYNKSFSFNFSPAFSALSANGQPANSTIDSTINLINNLLPKLNWAKKHGFAKVLDTASVLIQDKSTGQINRTISTPVPPLVVPGQLPVPQPPITATVALSVTPTIKSERSGLVELKSLNVNVSTPGSQVEKQSNTTVNTTISVRDRQSAAFGGVIKKGNETNFGSPIDSSQQFIVTLTADKSYSRNDSQFVVFVTPIIKSSASTGVEQVKKKFRLRD